MAAETLTAQTVSRDGLEATYAAVASTDGVDFVNTGKEFLHLKNGGGGDIVATLDIQTTVDGQAVTDRTVTITAGEDRFIGPFTTGDYNDGTNKALVTFDGVASLTAALLKLPTAS
jgi:hypothetical protein